MAVVENYDAFISYARHNANIALAIHHGLERYAKEKKRIRALRVFLDYNSLNVNDDLADSIKSNLSKSNYFILIASPESANSKWVTQELEYFYQLKGTTKNILIVLVSGDILWDKDLNNFSKEATDSIPKTEEQIFLKEPLYLDFKWMVNEPELRLSNQKFRTEIARIASAIRSIPLDILEGEYLKDQDTAYRHKRVTLMLRAIIGFSVGCLSLYFFTFLLQPTLSFIWALVAGSLICGIIGSIVLRLGRQIIIAYSIYFPILALIYAFVNVYPLNGNPFDTVIQIAIIISSFTTFGYIIGLFKKSLKQDALFAFCCGGFIAAITWRVLPKYFHADFQIFQAPWLFHRLQLVYNLIHVYDFEDVLNDVNPTLILLPIITGILSGSILFSLLAAGSDFHETLTLNRVIENRKPTRGKKYYRVVLFCLLILLSGYLITIHSNWYLKKTLKENLTVNAFQSNKVSVGGVGQQNLILSISNTLAKAGDDSGAAKMLQLGKAYLLADSDPDWFFSVFESPENIIYTLREAKIQDSIILHFINSTSEKAIKSQYSQPLDSIMLSRLWRTYGDKIKSLEILNDIIEKAPLNGITKDNAQNYLLIGTELFYHHKINYAKKYFNSFLIFSDSMLNAIRTVNAEQETSFRKEIPEYFNDDQFFLFRNDTGDVLDSLGYWSAESQAEYPIMKIMSKSGLISEVIDTHSEDGKGVSSDEFFARTASAERFQQFHENKLSFNEIGKAWYCAHPYGGFSSSLKILLIVKELVNLGKYYDAVSVVNDNKNPDLLLDRQELIIVAYKEILEKMEED